MRGREDVLLLLAHEFALLSKGEKKRENKENQIKVERMEFIT
jgi:hypothetical protein